MKACREEGREGRSRCSRGLTPGLGPRPQCCAFVLLPPPLEGHSHLAAEDEARLHIRQRAAERGRQRLCARAAPA